jgi:hypothetical protein
MKNTETTTVKAYKGYDKDMKCRDFQYEEGKVYQTKNAKLCEEGFHACESPLDCFRYYHPSSSIYSEVELSNVSDEKDSDSKRVGKSIKIGAKLDIKGLVKAQIEYVKSKTTTEHTDPKIATAGYRGAATAGDRGAATAGDRGAATAGEYGAATAGEYGAATAGEYGAATAGEYGAATAGEYGAATAGYRGAATAGEYGAATAGYMGAATAGYMGAATAGDSGAATAGYRGAATAGNSGAATAKGSVSVGENGAALVRGNNIKAKGGIGSILVLVEENEDNCDIKYWKAVKVDGKKIKADTWYCLYEGKIQLTT